MNGHGYQRGSVYWVDFTGSRGGEITKVRPAVIVSNDVANRHLNRVQVVPPTSSTGRVFPGEALVNLGDRSSKAMTDQIATIAKERIGAYLGQLTSDDMRRIEQAILRQLGIGHVRNLSMLSFYQIGSRFALSGAHSVLHEMPGHCLCQFVPTH